MKKYLFSLLGLLMVCLLSCDKNGPDARDAFVGTYVTNARLNYTVVAKDSTTTGTLPFTGKVYITKSSDKNGVLLAGDIYGNGTVEGDVLQIEAQHYRQVTTMGLLDVDLTFNPAQLVDKSLIITGKVAGSVTTLGQSSTFTADINAVATKQ